MKLCRWLPWNDGCICYTYGNTCVLVEMIKVHCSQLHLQLDQPHGERTHLCWHLPIIQRNPMLATYIAMLISMTWHDIVTNLQAQHPHVETNIPFVMMSLMIANVDSNLFMQLLCPRDVVGTFNSPYTFKCWTEMGISCLVSFYETYIYINNSSNLQVGVEM